MNRRDFIKSSTTAATALGMLGTANVSSALQPPPAFTRGIHIFSKHLQFLDYPEMAQAAADMGYDGVDLTVRPRGHVEPANAARDLPRAAAAIRAAGLRTEMCVTSFSSPDDDHFDSTLDAIAEAGFTHLRMGYMRYADSPHPAEQIKKHQEVVARLADALASRGLTGNMQNHAGERYVGASAWEYWQLLEGIDPDHLGLQFDVRHATAERGASWIREVQVAAPQIRTIILKDFIWNKSAEDSRARIVNTPLGDGWVDWERYFSMLRKMQIDVPVSMHCEYPQLGGAEKGSREPSIPHKEILGYIRRDLEFARKWMR